MFGDYEYGNEILKLPLVEEAFLERDKVCQSSINGDDGSIDYISLKFDPDRSYWFRWVTGHQVMIMFWHLLNKELYADVKLAEGCDDITLQADSLRSFTDVMNACTLIFQYAGSCTQGYYHQYIRPFMALYHKSFSGRWALDYVGLPQLIRIITSLEADSIDLIKNQKLLKNAYILSHKSHISISKKLVPEDDSLLKSAKESGLGVARVESHQYQIYDLFFLIHRDRTSLREFDLALTRRVAAIISDLKSQPIPRFDFLDRDPIATLEKATESALYLLYQSRSEKLEKTKKRYFDMVD